MSTDLHRDSCIDAERFAAWVDGGLSAEDAALVESHLADCARCQAMMAAFAKTGDDIARPATTAAVLPWRRRGAVRWALPLAAAAAASVTLWLAVSQKSDAPASTGSVARVEEAPARTPSGVLPQPAPEPAAQAPGVPQTPGNTRPVSQKNAQRAKGDTSSQPPPVIGPAPAPAPPPSPLAEPPPPVAAAAAEAAPATQTALSAQPAAAPIEAPPAVVSEFTSAAPFQSPAGIGSGNARVEAAAGRSSAPPPPSAPPPAPLRWRVFSNGTVERSSLSSTAWERIAVDPAIGITTGTAPSRSVCWLAGRRGAVLVSRDGGETFSRVDIPSGVDVTAIQALDHLRATVTSTGGQTLSTVDGGATWR